MELCQFASGSPAANGAARHFGGQVLDGPMRWSIIFGGHGRSKYSA